MEMALLIENNGRKERKVEENRERRKVSNYNKIKFALKFSFSFRSQINISLFIVKIDTFVLLLPANLLVWIFFEKHEKGGGKNDGKSSSIFQEILKVICIKITFELNFSSRKASSTGSRSKVTLVSRLRYWLHTHLRKFLFFNSIFLLFLSPRKFSNIFAQEEGKEWFLFSRVCKEWSYLTSFHTSYYKNVIVTSTYQLFRLSGIFVTSQWCTLNWR